MSANERFIRRSLRDGQRSLDRLGDEIRLARIARGLSQGAVAAGSRLSRIKVGRLEAGSPSVPILDYVAAAAAVGLDVSIRVYPVGPPLRDRAHAVLLERLRARLDATLRWRTEVPLPNSGDMRAWDAAIEGPGFAIGVEAETRVRDGQEIERRLSTKQRDGGMDHVILLLADTRSNRQFVRDRRASLEAKFPVSARKALAALADGRSPGGNSLVLL